ncbi:hypothetical protein NVP1074O_44 [Vibrio phage 1.074.O._10N.222.49.B7]|nr:hypothetical protein NVP1074O_44 [Vibrio phage 1.074.O._10N.222.49.B7]
MSKRKSFILHHDSLDVIGKLTDEQAGRLLKMIKAYQLGEDYEADTMTDLVFTPFKAQFKRDDEKYQNIVNRNKNNGLKGGRPQTQTNPIEPKKPTGLSGNPSKPKKADSDSKSKSDSDSKSKSKNNTSLDWSATQMNESEISEIKRIRSKAKADVTQRVINQLSKEFDLSRARGFTNDDILNEWSLKGWRSFKDEWMKGKPSKPVDKQEQIERARPTQEDYLSWLK